MNKINSRIQNKHDTQQHWELAENFIPLAGEIIIYEDNETGKPFGFKIGNGKLNQETGKIEGTKVNDLPFSIENIAIHNGNGENAIQQELRSETFTLVNEYVNSNTEVQKSDNGEIIAGALGFHAASFNGRSQALGKGAFAEGVETVALGKYSHAQGNATFAAGGNAHSEGLLTNALGESSHAEGNSSRTEGEAAHAEGYYTKASGAASHSEGFETQAIGSSSHAEGSNTQATADSAHAEGGNTIASGEKSHAEGLTTKAIGNNSHAEGDRTEAHGTSSHSEGANTKALKDYSHSEGADTEANGISAHAEGMGSRATGDYSHSEGDRTIASGESSHAEGVASKATKIGSHSEGFATKATGDYAHSEGCHTTAEGWHSHAEGNYTKANGNAAHSEGTYTQATAGNAHAEGYQTKATGGSAHAEGTNTIASGNDSHAGGTGTIAGYHSQTVIGKYNLNKEDTYFEVGNGSNAIFDDAGKKIMSEVHSNAFEVYKDGHAEIQTMGQTNNSVTTKKYVDDAKRELNSKIDKIASSGLKREILSQLPSIDVASENVIYMIGPKDDETYDEYMFINNTFELIGSTSVDLSDYYTKNEIDSPKDSILLKDTATGETYKICITNGKLSMEVVE